MKQIITSIIILSMLAIGITVQASDYDCELSIDANEHDEENPSFPTSGCDDMPALGWYADGEFTLSDFSGMRTVSDGEIVDLGMGTNVKITTIDNESKPKKKSLSKNSKSTKENAQQKPNDGQDTNQKTENKEANTKNKKEKHQEKNEKLTEEELNDKQASAKKDTDEETIEVAKATDESVTNNTTMKYVIMIAAIIIIGAVVLFIMIRKRKVN